jgi:hypothetical protein
MKIEHFLTLLKIGDTFVVDGEKFTKLTELTYRDAYGLEHYIDPLFDVKLGKVLNAVAEVASTVVDTSAKIVKDIKDETI